MQLQRFRLSQIGVIMLGVTDLGRAVEFYRDQLGLELSHSSGEFAFFNAGGVTLALSTVLPNTAGGRCDSVEVVFTVEHVRSAHAELRERGINFTHDPHLVTGQNWAANLVDPEGHRLSIFGPE